MILKIEDQLANTEAIAEEHQITKNKSAIQLLGRTNNEDRSPSSSSSTLLLLPSPFPPLSPQVQVHELLTSPSLSHHIPRIRQLLRSRKKLGRRFQQTLQHEVFLLFCEKVGVDARGLGEGAATKEEERQRQREGRYGVKGREMS